MGDQGDWDGAEHEYQTAMMHDPNNAAALYNLGVLEEDHRKNLDVAEQKYRESIAQGPTNPEPYYRLSRILEKQGDVVGAFESLEEYHRRGGEKGKGPDHLGRLGFDVARLRMGLPTSRPYPARQ